MLKDIIKDLEIIAKSFPNHRGRPGYVGGSLPKDIDSVTSDLVEKARRLEPQITKDIESLGGQMVGKEFALKSRGSLLRKITGEYLANPRMTPQQVADNIKDAIRYTKQFEPEYYTTGIQKTLNGLKKKGYEVAKIKNYWEKGDAYSGVNVVLKKEGQYVELQFHTKSSLETKEIIHKDYEVFRTSHDPQERKILWDKMSNAWDNVKIPPYVQEISGLERMYL